MRLHAAAAVFVSLLAACAPGRDLQPVAEYGAPNYQLGGGDKLRLIVFGEEQLSSTFRVDDRGNVALPLLGTVRAAGLTPEEFAAAVAKELRGKGLLRNPSVSVEIDSYRPIFVLGEVARPGQYAYQPGMTMLTSVAIAGGFTYRAVQDYAAVVRSSNKGMATEGLLRRNSYIAPGDVIEVYERRF